jgi:hypothetical protein
MSDLYIKVQSPPTTGWQRPTEWLTMPTPSAGEFYGLFLVFEDNPLNQVSVQANAGRVNWDFENDGTDVLCSGGVDTYNYDYATLGGAISVYTEDGSNRNYKQVIFKMNWFTSLLTQTTLYFNGYSGLNNNGTSGFADMVMDFTGCFPRIVMGRHDYLRIFNSLNNGSNNTRFYSGEWNIAQLKIFNASAYNPFIGMLGFNFNGTINGDISGSWSSTKINGINGNGVDIDGNNATLGWINNISNTSTGTDTFWLLDAQILGTIDMPNSSNMRRCFQSCTTRKLIFSAIHPNPTAITSNNGAFRFMRNLQELIVPNLERGFNIDNSNMGATALDAMFTSLGTANGTQTITITGNPGAATCTPQ